MNNSEIHVASISDNNYVQHLAVTLKSLLLNNRGMMIHLYVMTTGLTQENQAKLENIVKPFGVKIRFIQIDGTSYDQFSVYNHVNRESYVRLAVAEVLPQSLHKVIFIDSDVVVTGDISELWRTELKDHTIAAVSDEACYMKCKELEIPEANYFNAGILLINLSRWRELNIGARVMDYITNSRIQLEYMDQDALNALLFDDWLALPARWNFQTYMTEGKWREKYQRISPSIIHFTSRSKPWHFDNKHPYKKEYYKYLRKTEWKTYRPEIDLNRIIIRFRLLQFLVGLLKQVLPLPLINALKKLK